MRFGIMAMQMEFLLPSEIQKLPLEQALVYVAGFSHAGLVRQLAEHGFNPIELGGDLVMLLPHTFSPMAIQELAALKVELGIAYTVHLPLWSVEPSTMQLLVRQGSVQTLLETIQATRILDPEMYVLHATGALAAEFYRMAMPEVARAILLRQFQSHARESIQAILSQSGLDSRKIAIETIEFPFDLTLDLADELNLSLCLDTGHVLAGFSGLVDLFDVLERCLPFLGEVHLHDSSWQGSQGNINYGKDHQRLGYGDLDVGRFLDRLDSAGFDGPVIFELGLEDALASLGLIRSLRPELFT